MIIIHLIKSFWVEEEGVAATEYAVMLSLIVVTAIGSISRLGFKVRDIFDNATEMIQAATRM